MIDLRPHYGTAMGCARIPGGEIQAIVSPDSAIYPGIRLVLVRPDGEYDELARLEYRRSTGGMNAITWNLSDEEPEHIGRIPRADVLKFLGMRQSDVDNGTREMVD